jgi:hypothetical protein
MRKFSLILVRVVATGSSFNIMAQMPPPPPPPAPAGDNISGTLKATGAAGSAELTLDVSGTTLAASTVFIDHSVWTPATADNPGSWSRANLTTDIAIPNAMNFTTSLKHPSFTPGKWYAAEMSIKRNGAVFAIKNSVSAKAP